MRGGHPLGDPKGETEESNALAKYIRRLTGLDRREVTLQELSERFGYGAKQQWSDYCSGRKILPEQALMALVEAFAPPQLQKTTRETAKELWTSAQESRRSRSAQNHRKNVARVAKAEAVVKLRALREQLDVARERTHEARGAALGMAQLVTVLLSMVGSLQEKCVRLEGELRRNSADPQREQVLEATQQRLTTAERQLDQAQQKAKNAEELQLVFREQAAKAQQALMALRTEMDKPAATGDGTAGRAGTDDGDDLAPKLYEVDYYLESYDAQLAAGAAKLADLSEQAGLTPEQPGTEVPRVIPGEVTTGEDSEMVRSYTTESTSTSSSGLSRFSVEPSERPGRLRQDAATAHGPAKTGVGSVSRGFGRARKPRVMGIVLAGGKGEQLMPLTADRAKAAVPFGGVYRLVDFVLSNLVNGEITRICVLTQYKSRSLDRHMSTTWRLTGLQGNYVTPVPAQQRLGPRWFMGTADAIYQSLNFIHDERPDYVVVFGSDHVYRMDPRQMLQQHIDTDAGVTVAGTKVPREQASSFGVITTQPHSDRITGFIEKPARPPALADDPNHALASMGNYIFSTQVLLDALREDAANKDSVHDMGGSIMPLLTDRGQAQVYDFDRNEVLGESQRDHAYWRDVGTLDAYYEAHMDLISPEPVINLYNRDWPILNNQQPPAKFATGDSDSLVSAGAIIAGQVTGSVLAPGVVVEEGAVVEGGVLLPGVRVGRGAVVRQAVLDKNVVVPPGATVGVNTKHDAEYCAISPNGVVALGIGQRVREH